MFSLEYSVHLSWIALCVGPGTEVSDKRLHTTLKLEQGVSISGSLLTSDLFGVKPESVPRGGNNLLVRTTPGLSSNTEEKHTAAPYQSQQNINTQHVARVLSTGSVCVLLVEIRCQQSVCVSSQWTF